MHLCKAPSNSNLDTPSSYCIPLPPTLLLLFLFLFRFLCQYQLIRLQGFLQLTLLQEFNDNNIIIESIKLFSYVNIPQLLKMMMVIKETPCF